MGDILDESRAKETLARDYGYSNRLKKSEALWRELLSENCDNVLYFRGIEWYAH